MKNMKYLIVFIIISLLMVLGISYSFKGKIKEYDSTDFKVGYDSTWKVIDKNNGLKLEHKKTDSILNIQCKILETNYIDTKLNDIISDVIYGIEIQNSDYILINRMESPSEQYDSYSYLYENNDIQALVNIYKKDNKLIIIYYEAKSDVFDIVLDSVDSILDSLEIITGEPIS